MTDQHPYHLKPENYLELWKYFTDDAAKIKDRMWMIATLFFGGVSTMISFSTQYYLQLNSSAIDERAVMILLVVSVAIIGLCFYFKYIIKNYGLHIQSGWNRANYIRKQIPGLSEIWFVGDQDKIKEELKSMVNSDIPKEAMRLIFFTNLILCSYLLLMAVIISYFLNTK